MCCACVPVCRAKGRVRRSPIRSRRPGVRPARRPRVVAPSRPTAGRFHGLLQRHGVARLGHDAQLGARDATGEQVRARDRRHHVVSAVEHERGRADAGKRAAAAEAGGCEQLPSGHPRGRAMASEEGHVLGDLLRMLVPEACGEERCRRPGVPVAHAVRQHRPERAGNRAHPRTRGRRTACATADEHEALDSLRHPDRQLERHGRTHRQPDRRARPGSRDRPARGPRRRPASPSTPARATAPSGRRRGGRRRPRGRAAGRGAPRDRTPPRRSSSR